MIMPVATVNADNLKDYAGLPSGQIISPTYWLRLGGNRTC